MSSLEPDGFDLFNLAADLIAAVGIEKMELTAESILPRSNEVISTRFNDVISSVCFTLADS